MGNTYLLDNDPSEDGLNRNPFQEIYVAVVFEI